MKPLIFAALACLAAATASADEVANRPVVDQSPLPPIEKGWARINPYRGLAVAIEIGGQTFAQTCARCHGPEADPAGHPAPDLRRLDLACRRILDPDLRSRCLSDNDVYFSKSVREGKTIVGSIHMPPWEKVLGPKLIWALRSYIETRPIAAQTSRSTEDMAAGSH
jgi:mono/diheme cytochrome c family protein